MLLRLPHELKQVWREWLELHYPERAAHVMSLMQQMRGGKDYDSAFGTRMRGEGPFAQLIAQRFAKAHQRLGYGRLPALDSSQFVAPRKTVAAGRVVLAGGRSAEPPSSLPPSSPLAIPDPQLQAMHPDPKSDRHGCC